MILESGKSFFFPGVVIGSLGKIGGVLIGLAICWVLMNFEIIDIPPGVYPGGNRIPVLIDWFDVALTTLASFVICLLVTLYPSTKASRLNPVDLYVMNNSLDYFLYYKKLEFKG
ncbi:MAG: hypothetical protein CM1200mP30_32160 [Pseudomonadota bacterium]|nr:MAG: hypothetical protein CM1200mP30_32160 [Pseudomonadota bacterium]